MYERYLEMIESGKPIHWLQFWKSIPLHDKSIEDFKFVKSGVGESYVVSFASEQVKNKYTPLKSDSARVSAALHGVSHNKKVSYASLISYNIEKCKYEVVVFSQNGAVQCYTPPEKVVVIENKEVFFSASLLPKLLESHGINHREALVLLGNGNEVTNSLFDEYFKQIKQIYCLLDYDLGGLKIFDTLTKKHAGKVHFSTPSYLNKLNDCFRVKPSKDNFRKAIQLTEKHKLTELQQHFLQTSRMMEQEALLEFIG